MRVKFNLSVKGRVRALPFSQSTIIFAAVSFLGWCFEKVGRLTVFNAIGDRGFLSLPVCPIYGYTVLLIFFLAGTPERPIAELSDSRGSRLLRGLFNNIVYFLCAFVISSGFELATGLFFDRLLGVRLWDYSSRALDLFGYVCLGFSLMWGALITVAMRFFERPLCSSVMRIEEKKAKLVACIIWAVIALDFVFNVIYIAAVGEHFNFL